MDGIINKCTTFILNHFIAQFQSRTVLHWAAKQNHFKIVEYLLGIGADQNIQNNDGKLAGDLTTDSSIRAILKFGRVFVSKEFIFKLVI